MAARKDPFEPSRSPKAGRPPEVAAPRVRRGQKTAHEAVRTDTMILQAADGPHVNH
jgi:hypothetical protein